MPLFSPNVSSTAQVQTSKLNGKTYLDSILQEVTSPPAGELVVS